MNQPVRLAQLSRTEVADLADEAVLVLPIGATEQHGPHLPLGTDFLIVSELVEQALTAASTTRPVVLAPTIPYGHSEHHVSAGGAGSMRPQTLHLLLTDLISSFVRTGFRRIMIINGHGGNDTAIRTVVAQAGCDHPGVFAALSYWHEAGTTPDGEIITEHKPGHAGQFEASLLMALRPDVLPADRDIATGEPPAQMISGEDIGGGATVVRSSDWVTSGGWTDDPAGASPELGAPYRDHLVQRVASSITRFCELSAPRPPGTAH